jgi:hypothetical protein
LLLRQRGRRIVANDASTLFLSTQYGEDVGFAHQEQFIVVELDGFGGVAGEEDAVALFDLHRAAGAVIKELAGADGDDRATGGLVLGGVGDIDAAGGLVFDGVAFDDDFVAERLERNFGAFLSGGCGHVCPPGESC